jgi:hypothetical protein
MIKNTIYIAGGLVDDSKPIQILRTTYEYDMNENKLTRKADMVKQRYAHKMVCVSDQIVYALGGIIGTIYGTKYCNFCEKYDKGFDRWMETEPLFESKAYMSACVCRDRYIYVFGGFVDDTLSAISGTVEFLDTMMEKGGWKIVKFEDPKKVWAPFSMGAAVQLDRHQLLLFGGRVSKSLNSDNSYVYNIRSNVLTLLDCKITHPASFYQRHNVFYKDQLYIFDSTENDLHIFNPATIKWNIVKKAQWDVSETK